jgi:hypothetical protein
MSSFEQAGLSTPSAVSGRVGAIARGRGIALVYAGAIFLSAFLLFGVEPIMGKLILPWFGGSAAVWTVTVLFFQLALVLGYLYAHLLVRYVSPRRQMYVHVPVLLASLVVLPIIPAASWKPLGSQDPTLRILGLLAVTIGPPFLVLSTCGPLLQAWYARGGRKAYRLFAVSNGASLLGLLTYPLVVEPWLGTHLQAKLWSLAYATFVAGAIAITVRASLIARQVDALAPEGADASGRPRALDYVRWLALAAMPALLFLAVTNHLTRNVAPIPLLWVLPLGIYLISLILCFEGSGYRRGLFLALLPITLFLLALNLFPGELSVGITGQIAFFCGCLLICCMVCHGELARLKPPTSDLTAFYLTVAVGGALGGVFVAVIAPLVFNDYFELALGIVLCAVVALLAVAPGLLQAGRGERTRRVLALALLGATVVFGLYVLGKSERYHRGDLLAARNFYGALSVRETASGQGAVRMLYSGAIVHGEQRLSPGHLREPTSYYGPASGIGLLLRTEDHMHRRLRVGVVGLGVGTLAAYGRPGDSYRFYELDPNDVNVARTRFSYLRESPAEVSVVAGDGRLSLEREPGRRFDVFVADAFSGDAVPVHLLTIQAFRVYSRLLTPAGVIAVNISNRFLDLAPVIARAAHALGKTAVLIENPGEPTEVILKRSVFVLLVGDPRLARELAIAGHGRILARDTGRFWTDDYSNVLEALK